MTDTTPRYSVAFCEDIRQEVNGKHILIGVFGGNLIPGVLPQVLNLSLWVKINQAPTGAHSFNVGIISEQGPIGLDGNINFQDVEEGEAGIIAAGPFPVSITRPGKVTAFIQFDSEERQLIGDLLIKSAPHQ